MNELYDVLQFDGESEADINQKIYKLLFLFFVDKNVDYDVKVKGVEIIPDPVARGKPATFSISASTGTSFAGCSSPIFPILRMFVTCAQMIRALDGMLIQLKLGIIAFGEPEVICA